MASAMPKRHSKPATSVMAEKPVNQQAKLVKPTSVNKESITAAPENPTASTPQVVTALTAER